MRFTTRQVQSALNRHGYSLVVDNEMGPKTEWAISDFKGKHSFRKRPYIGPLTAALLFGKGKPRKSPKDVLYPPWLSEMGKHMYKHELRDNAYLRKWLKSDGRTLGDPAKLPWCGDCMETAIRLTLPKEPFPGALGKNPYWARNWALLGVKHKLALGAIVVIKRGSGGHIASSVGYDPRNKRIRIRGGNQSNQISDTWVAESRVLAIRKPSTWKHQLPPIPIMNSRGAVISTNEA